MRFRWILDYLRGKRCRECLYWELFSYIPGCSEMTGDITENSRICSMFIELSRCGTKKEGKQYE